MSKNVLYSQRKKYELHKTITKTLSHAKRLVVALVISGGLTAGFAVPALALQIPSNFPGNNGISCNAWHGAPGGFGPASPYYTVSGPQGGIGGQTFGQAQGVITGQNNSGYAAYCNQ